MSIADKLRELSKNLYYAWHAEFTRVFRDLQPDLWREVNHNPVEFLRRLAEQVVEDSFRDPRFMGKVVFLENYDINVARHLVQGSMPGSTRRDAPGRLRHQRPESRGQWRPEHLHAGRLVGPGV